MQDANERSKWVYEQPEMQKLCTVQMQQLSELMAVQARDRLRLGLALWDAHCESLST